MAYPNYIFSTFAFVGLLLASIPLPWHLEAWNTGTCLYMAWTAVGCLNQFINSIVWSGNAINWAPIWCDISSRIIIGLNVAIPACSLAINRRLYYIATCNTVMKSKAEKRRDVMVDLAIGIGIPFVQMILQYTVQGHRFNIFEDLGCFPFTYNIWPAYPVVFAWPVAIGLVSAVYCTLSIRAFMKRRSQFKELLSANNNLNCSRYFRLMSLASLEIICTLPFSAWSIYSNSHGFRVQPFLGWADTHWGFHRVDQIPGILWRYNRTAEIGFEFTRWAPVICAFIFFGFFGFADEARKHYKLAFSSVAKKVGYSTGTMSFSGTTSFGMRSKFPFSSTSSKGGLPVFVSKENSEKRDSMTSFNLSIGDVGGFLGENKLDYSLTSSSGSSSGSSSPRTGSRLGLPQLTDSEYSPSVSEPPALARPQPTLDTSSVHRVSTISMETRSESPRRPSRPASLEIPSNIA